MHGTPLFFPSIPSSSSDCVNGAIRKKPPFGGCLTHQKKRPSSSVCANGAMRKTAEERFNMLARGWLAYPVTSIHAHLPPKSGCRNHIPRLANNLYNRSSAVDSLLHNQPQVGKPTWGYNYTTALRRLPHPSSTTSKNAIRPSATIPKTRPSSSVCANGAMRKKPPKSGFIR